MRFILARHAETVFNSALRMQGNIAHTPLSRAGIAQAEAMAEALSAYLHDSRGMDIWASPAGRTLQTVAIIADHLDRDFFDVRTDPRLLEIVRRYRCGARGNNVSRAERIHCEAARR